MRNDAGQISIFDKDRTNVTFPSSLRTTLFCDVERISDNLGQATSMYADVPSGNDRPLRMQAEDPNHVRRPSPKKTR